MTFNTQRPEGRSSDRSGGEGQQVAIARALVDNPKSVLAEEAIIRLDWATGHNVFEYLLAGNNYMFLVLVTVTHFQKIPNLRINTGEEEVGIYYPIIDVCQLQFSRSYPCFSARIEQ
jgi:ABC-type lipoprotein export system ATPase subunit